MSGDIAGMIDASGNPAGEEINEEEEQGVQERPKEVKVVVVGDGAVGKTCLCNVFVKREFPVHYQPTCFENYAKEMVVDGQKVCLQLWDTAGQEGYDRIRILGYENTQCFVACFSVVDSVTFSNVKTAWLKELRENAPEARILLVGTKADLRGSKSGGGNGDERDEEVSMKKIKKAIKECGLSGYVETSARRGGADVDRVFHQAIRVAINSQRDANSGDHVDGQRRSLRGTLFSCFTT